MQGLTPKILTKGDFLPEERLGEGFVGKMILELDP